MPIQKVEVSITTTSIVRGSEAGPGIAPPKITLNGNPLSAPGGPAYNDSPGGGAPATTTLTATLNNIVPG